MKIHRLCMIVLFMLGALGYGYSQSLSEVNDGLIVMQPKVSYDGTKLVFIANYLGVLKPHIAEILPDSNKWSKPVQIFPSGITSRYDIRYPQLNVDNSKIYFSAKTQDKPDYDIYFSELKNGEWSEPMPVPVDINTSLNELSPAVSADEKKILFTRSFPADQKADDYCQELYLTELTETGQWSEATPLAPSYNTGCLLSPYFSRDNKTFFYASYEEVYDAEGKRISKNQFNIFWAKIDGLFQYNPKPIYELIGEKDNVSFSIDADSTVYYGSGVFSKSEDKLESNIVASTLPKAFRPLEMTLLSGKILGKDGSPLEATVRVIDPFTTKIFQEVKSNETGAYQVFIPQGSQYSVLALSNGYSTQSKLLETEGSTSELNFELFPSVDVKFNVFDADFYFPIRSNVILYDSAFNQLANITDTTGTTASIALGKELNVILSSENYFPDTINLPFDQEVIFDAFDFDVELTRKVREVDLSFTDEEGNNLGLEITVFNVTRNEKTKRQVKDGKVSLQLRDGEVYEISTSAKGYSYYSTELDLSKGEIEKEVKASLQSVENISLVLNNITFEYNSYSLNATSYEELDNLVKYLQENEQYNVEISAHTDNSGPDDYNLKLSNLRANAVLQYLQDNSINQNRLKAKGYGESQPIYPNDTEENMARNRRVEFKVLATE